MIYQPDIYKINDNNSCRYSLGMTGQNPLLVIGLNPSTADDQKPDQTLSKVLGFAERAGFDGFVMLNLYPKRTPYPDNLPKRVDLKLFHQNKEHVISWIEKVEKATILAAWGEPILKRKYLSRSLAELAEASKIHAVKWLKIGDFTKSGHPRHPSRAAYRLGMNDFDLENYLSILS